MKMKSLQLNSNVFLLVLFLFLIGPSVNGQVLKKIGKKAGKAAERALERRAEKEAQERTDRALDSILEPGKKGKSGKKKLPNEKDSPNDKEIKPRSDSEKEEGEVGSSTEELTNSLKVYSKL